MFRKGSFIIDDDITDWCVTNIMWVIERNFQLKD